MFWNRNTMTIFSIRTKLSMFSVIRCCTALTVYMSKHFYECSHITTMTFMERMKGSTMCISSSVYHRMPASTESRMTSPTFRTNHTSAN